MVSARFTIVLVPLLLLACTAPPARQAGATLRRGALELIDWRATNSVGRAGASLFGVISSRVPDTLQSVRTALAERVTLHFTESSGIMQPTAAFGIEAGERLALRDQGPHAMMESLVRALEPGDSVTITFRFARAGEIELRVPVVRLTEAATELP